MFLLAIRGAPKQGSMVWWPPLLALLPPPLLRAQLQFCTSPLHPNWPGLLPSKENWLTATCSPHQPYP